MIFQWKQAAYIKTPAQIAGEVCLALEQQGNLDKYDTLQEVEAIINAIEQTLQIA